MPATAPLDVSKTKVTAELQQLQKRQVELVEQARLLEQTATDENRELSPDEEHDFHMCLEEAERLETEYKERLAADQRAARRALVAEAEHRVSGLPNPRTILTTGSLARVQFMDDRILADPRRGFKHIGEFAAAIVEAYTPGRGIQDERLLKISAAATGMEMAQGSHGGFAVPPQFSSQIWDGMATMPDNLMGLCDTYTVTGESLTIPATNETSRANGSRYGGVRGYWLAEAAQKTPSYPTLRQMKLEPQELAVLVFATDKLLRNAPALEQYIRRAAGEEIMFMVNDSIIRGTGAGQPLGILNSPGLITVAAEGGQGADSIEVENINRMYARLHTRARAGAMWLYNQEIEAELDDLSMVIGAGGVPVMLPAVGLSGEPIRRLKGLPMRAVEYASGLGDVGDLMLVNLGFYALGVQGGIDEAMSIHLRFDYNETAFRFVFSVDGQPWIHSPITPYKGTSTLSPFITLAAR